MKVREVLAQKKRELEARFRQLSVEDPFADKTRLIDNASSDTEAREEVGHERAEALKNEIGKNIALVKKALSRLGIGKYGLCENCNKPIDKARLQIVPQAVLCIECEQNKESA